MFTKDIINDYADELLIGLTEEENELLLREFDVINDAKKVLYHISENNGGIVLS